MRPILLTTLFVAALPAFAGGDALEILEYECAETVVLEAPTKVVMEPIIESWRICMIYDSQTDGTTPGSVVVTLRDVNQPDNSPHLMNETVLGFSPSSDQVRAESCFEVNVGQDQVLSAVKSAGTGASRLVRACALQTR